MARKSWISAWNPSSGRSKEIRTEPEIEEIISSSLKPWCRQMKEILIRHHEDLLTRLQPPVFDFDALPASASHMAAAPVAGAAVEHLASEMEHLPFDGRMTQRVGSKMSKRKSSETDDCAEEEDDRPQMSWKKLVIDDVQHEQRAIAMFEQRKELAQKKPEAEKEDAEEATNRFSARLQRFVESSHFEGVVALVLISNSIFMGVQLQLAADSYGLASQADIEGNTIFITINTIYALLFTVELMFRVSAHRLSFFCTTDRASLFWNYMDITLVLTSLLEVILVIAISMEGLDLGMSNRLRALRIVRLARLIRMMRAMRFFRGLRTLVYSIFYTLKALIWSLILLLMMMYLVGILLTDAVLDFVSRFNTPEEIPLESDEALLYESFGSLHLAMHTLFRSITGGVDWAVYAKALAEVNWLWTYLFTAFIAFSVFAVLNVMTGVFCQRATELAERDKEAQLMAMQIETEHICEEARRLFLRFDVVRQGSLTLMEVELMMQDEDVKAALAALDLAVHDAWRFFRLLDANGSGAVTEDEFVQGCLRLRGPARTFDVASLSEENLRMKTKLTNLEEQEMFIQQLLNHLRIEVMQVGKVAAQAKQAVEEATFARAEESKKPQLQSEDDMEGDGQSKAKDKSSQEVKEPQQVQQGQTSTQTNNADWTALQEASSKMALATADFAALIQQCGQVQGFQPVQLEVSNDVGKETSQPSSPVNPVAPRSPLPIAPAPPMSQPVAVFWMEPNVPEGLPRPNRDQADLPYFCER